MAWRGESSMRAIKRALVSICLSLIMILGLSMVMPSFTQTMTVEAANKIKLNKKKATIYVGKSVQLKIKGTKAKVKWTSDHNSVAKVSSKGKVTGKKAGKAVITAKVKNKKYKCTITVKKKKTQEEGNSKPQTIKISELVTDTECKVRMGSKKTITVSYLPLNANEEFVPTFTSWDTNIVAVSKTGELTPINIGKTIVEVKFGVFCKTINITILESKAKLIEAENARYETELDELYDTYSQYLEMIDIEIEAVREMYGYYYGTRQQYQSEVYDLNEQINTIKIQMAAYSGDSSEEAKVKLQKLQVSLNSYEDQLNTLEDEWYGRTMIESLNEMADLYIEEYNEAVKLAKNKHTEKINEINADIE